MEASVQTGAAGPDAIRVGVVSEVTAEGSKATCRFKDAGTILVSSFLAAHVGSGDEISFPLAIDSPATGTEVYVRKKPASRQLRDIYQAPIRYAAQPKPDKREELYVRAEYHPDAWAFPRPISPARPFGTTSTLPIAV
ncbi:MAG TPA: hypothetical protein VIX19_15570 [Terriglobales bacterium]